MKTLTIIALLCSCICYGQCKYKVNEKDPFTKQKKIRLKDKSIGFGKMLTELTCTIAYTQGHKVLYLKHSNDLGCVSSGSYATLLFYNDSTITIKHAGEIDCGDNPSLILILDDYVDLLEVWDIYAIRVMYDEYQDMSIYSKHKKYISDGLSCLKSAI